MFSKIPRPVLSALVALLGAAVAIASMSSAGSPYKHETPALKMFQQLARASTSPVAASQFGMIDALRDIRATALGPSNAGLRTQVDALLEADKIGAEKCTVEQQQWLIRQMLKYKQSQLGAYVDSVRARQRELCLSTFKARLDAAILQDQEVADTEQRAEAAANEVGELAQFLQESADSKQELYKLNDVPLESLVGALREYTKLKLNLQEVPSMTHHLSSETNAANDAQATLDLINGRLMGACRALSSAYGDFVWMLKIFEPQRPAGLSSARHERVLWLTKVCNSLEFNSFSVKLYEHYHDSSHLPSRSRKHIEKFSNLLRTSDSFELVLNNKVAPGDAPQALETLAGERHFRSATPADAAHPDEEERAELAASCADVRRSLSRFLWLIDLRLVRVALDSREIVELLKPARVCELLPELLSQ